MAASTSTPSRLTGACLCGAIEFAFAPDRTDIHVCHCGQCRAWSGHYWASVNAPFDTLKIKKGERSLAWFRSSDWARRGFCKECGSALFWHGDKLEDHKHRIAVAAGALSSPTGLHIGEHIFVADKGDYYEIADGLPQKDKY
jgi:hypothetical protein